MEHSQRLNVRLAVNLANPRTWTASIYPALFGGLYCLWTGLPLRVGMALVLLCICVLMQSGVNTLNDYFDFVKGTDTEEDCLERDDSVLVYEHADPRQVLLLGAGFLAAAAVLGAWVVYVSGDAPLAVGIVGGLAVVCYSAGPLPLSYLPVGELVSGFTMGGLIPLGIAAAVSGTFRWEILPPAAPFILSIALIMMTNNTCDIEKDRAAGRKTLPALLGRTWARHMYQVLVVLWAGLLCVLPYWMFGLRGLVAPVLLLLFGRRSFGYLVCGPLTQSVRIEQMRNIIEANLTGNGAYLAAFLAALL